MTARIARALVASVVGCAALSAQGAVAPGLDEPAHQHVTTRGDTLIGLGRKLLVDPSRWREVAQINAVRNPNRIPVGTRLRIPLRLMRQERAPATVLSVTGQVSTGAGTPVATNQQLDEGSEVLTGADGHATVRLVDGTVLRLRPSSRMQLRESSRLPDAGLTNSGVRLPRGRAEIEAAPTKGGKPGFRIDTPQGLLGVRGTVFRVASDGEGQSTRGEVLDGTVDFSGAGAPAVPVPKGFGSVIAAGGQVAPPVKLLDAPDLSSLPTLHERLLVRVSVPPVPGAVAYRAQVAPIAAPEAVLADQLSASPELRIENLPDGELRLRVRAVDARGLEGRDAEMSFRLKARPEAPLPSAPAPRAVLFGGQVAFEWTANPEARSYRLQIGTESGFETPVREVSDLSGTTASIEGLPPGSYQWRLASERDANDRGPWSAARAFHMRPQPPATKPPAVGDRQVSFEWESLPGQRFDFEMARDAAFADRVLEQRLNEPRISLPTPAPGRYFVRLRAIESDGFVGPYTTPQRFEITNCLRDAAGSCVRAADAPLTMAP